ncbi:MAG: hypothetical protein ACPLPR_01400 [Bacillota bacterium]
MKRTHSVRQAWAADRFSSCQAEPLESRTVDQVDVVLPMSLTPQGTCRVCGGSNWWVSRYGAMLCVVCHPPAMHELVARFVGQKEAAALAAEKKW